MASATDIGQHVAFFDVGLNKLLTKRSSGRWFEALVWCHSNGYEMQKSPTSYKKIAMQAWYILIKHYWAFFQLIFEVIKSPIFCYIEHAYCNVYIWRDQLRLTLLVLRQEYSGMIRSIPWLLMPCHEQPCYWLCRINRSLASMREDVNCLRHLNVEKL